jgi:peptidoglycan-associated lipoprotein
MRYILVAIGAVALAMALAACPKKKPKNPTCDSDTDCKDGETCVDKACVAKPDAKDECTKDADCSDGQVCKAGSCTACAGDGECGPGGKCSAGACERAKACTQDEDCEDDEDCVDGFCQSGGGGDASASCSLATIYFGFDDSSIQQSERDRLDANAACIEKNTGKGVYVFGHTDESGTDEYNIALSERRARSAADYLSRLGVDPATLDVVGKGETELTGAGDDQDRRVEFQFH